MDERVGRTGIEAMTQIGASAEAYFRAGECCSEALVHAIIDHWSPGTPPETATMVQGLCGGMGNKRATCGVFTGGAVAIGIVAQAQSETVDAKRVKQITARFQELLEREWGDHICGNLLKGMGMGNWNRSHCRRLTCRGAELVVEILHESELC